MITNKDNFCVIMGGGIGSRFWPFSRKTLPKQFLDFFGTGRSLLQQTFDRFSKVIPTENILVVTNDLYADLVKEQLPELKPEQILLEPTRRNTAPCPRIESECQYSSRSFRPSHPKRKRIPFSHRKRFGICCKIGQTSNSWYQAQSSGNRIWLYTDSRTHRQQLL